MLLGRGAQLRGEHVRFVRELIALGGQCGERAGEFGMLGAQFVALRGDFCGCRAMLLAGGVEVGGEGGDFFMQGVAVGIQRGERHLVLGLRAGRVGAGEVVRGAGLGQVGGERGLLGVDPGVLGMEFREGLLERVELLLEGGVPGLARLVGGIEVAREVGVRLVERGFERVDFAKKLLAFLQCGVALVGELLVVGAEIGDRRVAADARGFEFLRELLGFRFEFACIDRRGVRGGGAGGGELLDLVAEIGDRPFGTRPGLVAFLDCV